MPETFNRAGLSLITSLGEIENQLRAACEAYTYVLPSRIEVYWIYWALIMSSPIRRLHKLRNQSPVPGGVSDLQIVLPPSGLDHLVEAPG